MQSPEFKTLVPQKKKEMRNNKTNQNLPLSGSKHLFLLYILITPTIRGFASFPISRITVHPLSYGQ
jgi:hypothetical protein